MLSNKEECFDIDMMHDEQQNFDHLEYDENDENVVFYKRLL